MEAIVRGHEVDTIYLSIDAARRQMVEGGEALWSTI
jgi:hypothetical protein